MVYIVYYTCPHCTNPDCGEAPEKRANEMLYASSKKEAREKFTHGKPCRHMKICEIKETTLCTG